MNKKTVYLALACAFLAPFVARCAVPYAESSEISASGDAVVGDIHWHRSAGGAPFLSVGNFGGGRETVRDPDALHRVPLSELRVPDYSISLGDGVTVSNGFFVLWSGEETGSEQLTHEVSLMPAAGWEIVSVEVADLRDDKAFIEVGGGAARIFRQQNGNVPGFAATTDCAFGIVRVLARDASRTEARDDLTRGDYLFSDTVGDCSLGTIRPWTLAQLEGQRGEDWARHPATEPVRLAGQSLVFDGFGRFHTDIGTVSNANDTITLWANGRAAMRVTAGENSTESAFRIVDYATDNGTNVAHVTAIGTNIAVLAAAVVSTPFAQWTEESGVSVDYTPVQIDGADCYTVRWPAVGSARFFRARTSLTAESVACVEFGVPVVLKSPDGTRWRIKVANDGTLSTEAWQ